MKKYTKALLLTFNILMACILAFPLFYAVSLSFMNSAEIHAIRLLPAAPVLYNYTDALKTAPLLRFIMNSFIVSSVVMLSQIFTGSLAGYALSILRFKGQKVVFLILLSTMMIPLQVIMIANYMTITKLHLLDSMISLILPYMTSSFCIFNMRLAFMKLPYDLKEASVVDGCGDFRFYISIAMPIIKPNIAAIGIYSFVTTWNQYLWPLLVTNTETNRTVQIGMGMLLNEDSTNVGVVMAGAVIVLIPTITIFVIGHKYIVAGLTAGAVKG